jgi:hypothetical protein
MIPKTKQRNAFPGDTGVIFISAATDASGKQYPKGTEMVPLAGGYSNPDGCKYQEFSAGPSTKARFLDR